MVSFQHLAYPTRMGPESPRPLTATVTVVDGVISLLDGELPDSDLVAVGARWNGWIEEHESSRLSSLAVDELTLVRSLGGKLLAVRKVSVTASAEKYAIGNAWALLDRARDGDKLFDVSLDLVCIAGLDGFFSRVSPSFEETLGWTDDELYSRPFVDFVHPEDVDATLDALDGLADGESVIGFENRYQTKDGGWRWLGWTARYHATTDKIYALARDITAERKLRIALAEARDEAQMANQAKSQFLASMSHELRTPLNAIIGYSEMLTEDAEAAGDETLVRDLSQILHAGSQLLTLINGVLDLSKVEAGRIELFYEMCDLKTVLTEAAQTVGPQAAQQNNRLVMEFEDVAAETDQMKLTQVVLNLLSNAAKFTKDGEIRISLKRLGEMAEIRVEDTGAGMSEEELQEVFIPFQQGRASFVSRSHGGTGLGLSIAAKFIELLDGTMDVTSEDGQGTQFRLTLPLMRPARGRARAVAGGTLVVVGSKH